MRGTILLVLILGLVGGRVASADRPRKAAAEAQARRLYAEGQELYKAGRYDDAVEKYSAAHDLLPRPFFLFNIAQAYRLGGQKEKALAYYKAFQAASPEAFNAGEVRERIKELEVELARPVVVPPPAEAAAAVEPAPTPAPEAVRDLGVPRARPIYKRWWFWAGIGAVTATAVTIAAVSLSGGGGVPATDLGTTTIFNP